jgi:hypothetical protein
MIARTIVMAAILLIALAMMLWPVALFAQDTTIIVQPQASPNAPASSCPSDRPHKLEIETGTMSCAVPSCMGRMDCGTGTCKISRDLGADCSSCRMRTYVACLSEQDLKSIRR